MITETEPQIRRERGLSPTEEFRGLIANPETCSLVEGFLKTRDFKNTVRRAIDFFRDSPDTACEERYRREFAGYLFEQLAAYHLRQNLSTGEFVLTPAQTLEFSYILTRKSKEFSEFGLHVGISGVTIPDGMVFKVKDGKTVISGLVEATLQKISNSPRKQEQFILLTRWLDNNIVPANVDLGSAGVYLNKLYPKLSSEIEVDPKHLRIIYLVLKDSFHRNREWLLAQTTNIPIEIYELPLTWIQFAGFLELFVLKVKEIAARKVAAPVMQEGFWKRVVSFLKRNLKLRK